MPGRPGGATTTYEIDRLLALSDGVFAIVITLLVLDLKLPDPPAAGSDIVGELSDNVPELIGWAVSFLVVSRLWMIHHHVLAHLRRVRAGTIVTNFAFLGVLSLLPFGASLVGIYEASEPLAIVVFSVSLGLAAFALGVFTSFAARDDAERASDLDIDIDWHLRHHLVIVPGLSVVAGVLAFVHPLTALIVWTLEAALVVVVLVVGARVRSSAGR